MTANDIRSGRAFSVAVSAEYRKFLQILVQAIDFCSERRNEEATLTKVGRAGFERINELFAKEQPVKPLPKDGADCEAWITSSSRSYLSAYFCSTASDCSAFWWGEGRRLHTT